MIITDQFVLLNFPRTGSTFVREALASVYGRGGSRFEKVLGRFRPDRDRFRELLLPIDRTTTALKVARKSQHGCYSQIPAADRGKPVLCVKRNPFERFVSQFEQGFWRENPPGDLRELQQLFPEFPDLSFSDYLKMDQVVAYNDVRQGAAVEADVGTCTLHFIRFFYPDPVAALAGLSDERIDSGEFLRGMPDIHFLQTENLVPGLRAFLSSVGFDEDKTSFLVDKPRVNGSPRRGKRTWRDYFTPGEAERYRQRNRLLFQMFPECND